MLSVALEEARAGLAEEGIPIGAAAELPGHYHGHDPGSVLVLQRYCSG